MKACPECNGNKRVLLLETFVPCSLCGEVDAPTPTSLSGLTVETFNLFDDDIRAEALRLSVEAVQRTHPQFRGSSGAGWCHDGINFSMLSDSTEKPTSGVLLCHDPCFRPRGWKQGRDGVWYHTVHATSIWLATRMGLEVEPCECVKKHEHGCCVGRPYPLCPACRGRGFVAGLQCACGETGCQLWRPAGSFYRPENNRCQACAEAGQGEPRNGDSIGWYVPLVRSPSGEVWGLFSAPEADVARWRSLPSRAKGES